MQAEAAARGFTLEDDEKLETSSVKSLTVFDPKKSKKTRGAQPNGVFGLTQGSDDGDVRASIPALKKKQFLTRPGPSKGSKKGNEPISELEYRARFYGCSQTVNGGGEPALIRVGV